eukprot:2448299-Prymnesium_polylepis.1
MSMTDEPVGAVDDIVRSASMSHHRGLRPQPFEAAPNPRASHVLSQGKAREKLYGNKRMPEQQKAESNSGSKALPTDPFYVRCHHDRASTRTDLCNSVR